MKIAELIRRLSEIAEKTPDVDVVVASLYGGSPWDTVTHVGLLADGRVVID